MGVTAFSIEVSPRKIYCVNFGNKYDGESKSDTNSGAMG